MKSEKQKLPRQKRKSFSEQTKAARNQEEFQVAKQESSEVFDKLVDMKVAAALAQVEKQ